MNSGICTRFWQVECICCCLTVSNRAFEGRDWQMAGGYKSGFDAEALCIGFVIPAKARDYVFTGVGLSVSLFVCYHDN